MILLPRLFAKVWIPGTVPAELRHKRTPAAVGRWAEQLRSWIEVRHVGGAPAAHELAGLDHGEWEAIELAKEIQANLLLIDERAGVRVAREQRFTVTRRGNKVAPDNLAVAVRTVRQPNDRPGGPPASVR